MAQKLNVEYIRLYTDGTAARKIAPAAPRKKPILPKPHRQQRKVLYLDPVATLGMAVALCMLVMMAVGVVQLRSARQELAQMQSYVERLSAEHESLQGTYTAGYDLDKVRQTALALDMIPAEQAQRVTVCVPVQQENAQTVTLWQRIGTFLSGLFA